MWCATQLTGKFSFWFDFKGWRLLKYSFTGKLLWKGSTSCGKIKRVKIQRFHIKTVTHNVKCTKKCWQLVFFPNLKTSIKISQRKNFDPGRTWTCNLRCRKPTPYPLGHRADVVKGGKKGLPEKHLEIHQFCKIEVLDQSYSSWIKCK